MIFILGLIIGIIIGFIVSFMYMGSMSVKKYGKDGFNEVYDVIDKLETKRRQNEYNKDQKEYYNKIENWKNETK